MVNDNARTLSEDARFVLTELADWIDNRYNTTKALAQLPNQPFPKEYYEGAKGLITDLAMFYDYITDELAQRIAPISSPKKAKIIPFIPRPKDDDDDDE